MMMPFPASVSPSWRYSLPLPARKLPPLKQIRTGIFSSIVCEGVHTFRYRQSSLNLSVPKIISGKGLYWIGFGPKSMAERTPAHSTAGCGAFHRSLPTGGCAYGMPLNIFTPERSTPSSTPSFTFTLGPLAAEVSVAVNAKKKNKIIFLILLINRMLT